MSPNDRTFEFLLNAMEHAAQAKNPARAGYAAKRRAVLTYVAQLEARAAAGAAESALLAELDRRLSEHGEIHLVRDGETVSAKLWLRRYVTSLWAEGRSLRDLLARLTQDRTEAR